MKPTREQVLLAAGLASVLGAGLLLVAADSVPLGPLEPLTDADTATQAGLVLGLVVVGLAVYQMRRSGWTTLDRSGLLPAPPEQAHDAPVPTPGASLAATYRRLRERIERSGPTGWHVAAYGRRARGTAPATRDDAGNSPSSTPPPERPPERPSDTRAELLDLLDDVAATARDTYATATDCDDATAERAVAAGEWTDDRVAAAFLAADDDAPTFTVTERALAWLAPRRTLDRRLERTLDAIESHADGYLTYRTPIHGTAEPGEHRSETVEGDQR